MSQPTASSLLELLRDPVPLVAVSFDDRASDAEIEAFRAAGLDVAELRIDQFADHDVAHVVAETDRYDGLATIATIRSAAHGGGWTGTDDEVVALLEAVLPSVDAIDVELSSLELLAPLIASAKAAGRVVIVSHHDFERMPGAADLAAMAAQAKQAGADIVKLAAMANGTDDVRALAAFTVERADLGLITIAMGEHGMASRVFFPALGSALTFAFGSNTPVSGQLSFAETMAELRRFFPDFAARKQAVAAATVEG